MRRLHRCDYIDLVLSCTVIDLVCSSAVILIFIPAVPPDSCLLYDTCESDSLSSEHTDIRLNNHYRFGSLCELLSVLYD
ncbi:hypothetical protein PO909_024729 [Leuciscus waleckii]